nr:MAG TPA: hypothetical protein [Herelleviridae sp.]
MTSYIHILSSLFLVILGIEPATCFAININKVLLCLLCVIQYVIYSYYSIKKRGFKPLLNIFMRTTGFLCSEFYTNIQNNTVPSNP